jgi:hypothetical protein
VHRHPYYRERFKTEESYPVAEDAYERLISLPMFHAMTAQDVEDVIHALHKVLTCFEGKYEEGKASARMGSRPGNQNKSCR